MLGEFLSALGPVLGWCQYSPRFAELVLLVLISFSIGCCCGGLLVGLVASAHCRGFALHLLYYLLEGGERPRTDPGRALDRLQRYRA